MQAIALRMASFPRLGAALGVLLPLLIPAGSAVAIAADLTLEEIRATLRELETSTTSLSIRYTLLAGSVREHNQEFEYQKSDRSVRIKQWAPDIGTMLSTFDGTAGYDVAYESPASTKVKQIVKAAAIPLEISGGHNPLRWWGFEMPGGIGRPLHEMLERGRITGNETVGDFEVVNVDLGEWTNSYGDLYDVQCQLSVRHDYCPVVIRTTGKYEGAGKDPDFVVSEFRRVWHPLLAREVWMPSRMTFGERMEFTVNEVQLNPDIPETTFVPKPDVGTLIIDDTAPGGQRMSVHAAAEARQQAIQHAASRPPTAIPPAPARPVIATPNVGWSLPTYLWLIPVIALIAIVVIRFTRSGS